MAFCLAARLAILLVTITDYTMADTFYCDNEFCQTPDKYCCGPNECCTYVWTLWYLWLAFACVVSITLFTLWKYYLQKHYLKSSNKRISDLKAAYHRSILINSSFGGHSGSSGAFSANASHRNGSSSSSILHSLDYKPLNDVVYVENQLDDNTVEFSILKN